MISSKPFGPKRGIELGSEREDSAEAVRDIVAHVALELHPSLAPLQIDPKLSLQDDLGIDSLGRAELAARIERLLGITLSDEDISASERVQDLLDAVQRYKRQTEGRKPNQDLSQPVRKRLPLEEVPSPKAHPDHAQTFVEVLEWQATRSPKRKYLEFVGSNGSIETLDFYRLFEGSKEIAAGLQSRGLKPSESVAIMLPSGLEFFYCYFGVMLAGGVVVPLYPPDRPNQIEESLKRQMSILTNSEARFLITLSEGARFSHLLRAALRSVVQVLTPADLRSPHSAFRPLKRQAQDVVLLQYTSGSTGDPKGVILTHENLLANVRAMGANIQASSEDIFVSWLPLYHDMGLIGACLGTLYYGAFLALMSPLSFLAKSSRWLWMIHHYRGTLSAAPNFAYELCATRLATQESDGLDLRSWRVAFNGAEPVSASTLQRFTERFRAHGFRPEAMTPVYGLAEASVGLVFPPLGGLPRIDWICRKRLIDNKQASPCRAGQSGCLAMVSCGYPLHRHRIRVTNDRDHVLPERSMGHIQFQGPSCTQGYYKNPSANQLLFHPSKDSSYPGVWLDSGDLGYLAEGELFVTGRSKDVIIRGGRHFFPEDVEERLGELPGVRKGCVAVFGSLDPSIGMDRIIAVAETRVRDPIESANLRSNISAAAAAELGSAVDEVILVPPRSVPKTPSGKLRRSSCKALYDEGHLGKRKPIWIQWLSIGTRVARLHSIRAIRSIGRVCFAFYAWLVVVILFLPPLIIGLILLPSLKARHSFSRNIARLAFAISGIPLKIRDTANLKGLSAGAVLIANHSSYLDAIVLKAILPIPVRFVAKKEFEHHPLMGPLLRRLDCLFVERFAPIKAREDAVQISEAVRQSQAVLIFPEGTFSAEPGLKPFRMGAFLTAVQTAVPLLPISIRGTRHILPSWSWKPRPGSIEVTFFPALHSREASWQEALLLRQKARQNLSRSTGEPELPE